MTIIPEPESLTTASGHFNLNENTIIYSDLKNKELSEYLKSIIFSYTNFKLLIQEISQAPHTDNSISIEINDLNEQLGNEGYILEITPQHITLSAYKPAGIFYCIQTIRQLLPIKTETLQNNEYENSKINCLKIEDYPRFSWRGFMLDEARHFHGKQVVKTLLDLMAMLKMNVFHWHLSDDQGFRIEIKEYPNFTKIGSKREESQVVSGFRKKMNGIPHSGFYSQEDIKEIIIYASARFITVIPEVDIPGHSRAILASYPNLGCRGHPLKVSTHWGIHRDILCVGKEITFKIIQEVLDEIISLFPSNIIHIGGDEVPKSRWKECPDCQLRIKNEGLKNEKGLKAYFISRVINYLKSKGQRVIAWNDILHENLERDIIIQYWILKKKKVINHLKKGGEVIMSNFKYTYLDHSYSFTPLKLAYEFEPIPKELEQQYHKHVLGLEALMWGEYTPNTKRLGWQTFPRLIAFSEVGWTSKNKKNYKSFLNRLKQFLKMLDTIGINYAKLSEVNPSFIKRFFGVFSLLKYISID